LGLSAYQYKKAQKEKQKADAALENQRANRPSYKSPQALKDELAEAKARSGAVSPAVQMAQAQALKQQANQIAAAQRNASSGAQAIQSAANASAQANSILPGLADLQQNFDLQNRQQLTNARGAGIEDSRVMQQDALNRQQEATQFELGKVGAAQNDKSQALGLGLAALNAATSIYGVSKAFPTQQQVPVTATTPVAGVGVGQGYTAATGDTIPTPTVAGTTAATGATPMASPIGGTADYSGLTPLQIAYLKKMGRLSSNPYYNFNQQYTM
jgi:hypothetical protein